VQGAEGEGERNGREEKGKGGEGREGRGGDGRAEEGRGRTSPLQILDPPLGSTVCSLVVTQSLQFTQCNLD